MAILVLQFLMFFLVTSSVNSKICGPGRKNDEIGCIPLTNLDVQNSINWLAKPPSTFCSKTTAEQNIPVCEDKIRDKGCTIWSIVMTNECDDVGSLLFEKAWSQRCQVHVFQMSTNLKGNSTSSCSRDIMTSIQGYDNLFITKNLIWGGGCFNCLYSILKRKKLDQINTIDVLKIQRLDAQLSEDTYDGSQYTVLSDFFLHLPHLADAVQQVVMTVSLSSVALTDNVGREAEHGWNMWASRMFLKTFASFSSSTDPGPFVLQPRQFDYLLGQVGLPTNVAYYHHSFLKLTDVEAINKNEIQHQAWRPVSLPPLIGQVPSYCRQPQGAENDAMQQWILEEMNARCHPYRLWVPCDFSRAYDAFIPCPQELMNHLSEDYAAMKGWCDFQMTNINAEIPDLKIIDPMATIAFQKSQYSKADKKVRLAFMFTVYSDAPFVKRLVSLLYSPDHYYLLHIDPAGSKPTFVNEMKEEIRLKYAQHNNVFITQDVPIVYGASTATILLTKTMAWFLRKASGWDYFVPVTGSDYPLMPLQRFEAIFIHQSPPMPFVMAWTPGTSTHLFRLQKTHPVFENDPLLFKSIEAVTSERGKLLGQVPMEYRSNNFGPPLFCNGQKTFYHLDNRRNKTGAKLDSQWLFPRDVFKGRGRAFAEENREFATPSFDNVWRVWKKSDPATTAAYDRETVEYIINSEEGRKYYHFFKHMLLGSEEHYYVSLLYNWNRTRSFVQTLSAEMVWNTWESGLWESSGGFQTHTHFLTEKEFDLMKGFSKRGMMFARKLSTKKTSALIKLIDDYIHNNASTDAGLFWPGYFETDIWTPGRQWVAALRRNETIRREHHKRKHAERLRREKEMTVA